MGEQIQDIYNQATALTGQAECWVRLDRWDEVHFAEEKIQILQRRYPVQRLVPICWLLFFSAVVHAWRGEEERAARLADESYQIMAGTVYDSVGASGEENWHSAHYY